MLTVALSAGHQLGVDNGYAYGGLLEADLTIQITKRAAAIIRKHSMPVLEVPDNLSLLGTISWINTRANQIDICVEVHMNANWGTGVEAWYYTGSTESRKLSQFIVDASVAETGLKSRGARDEATSVWKRLAFVHDTDPLASLAECAFLDGDYNFVKKPENIERMARGIARGILSYAGVKWNPALLLPPAPPTKPYYAVFDAFYRQFNGYSLDYDGYYGGQCFDLIQAWNRDWLKVPAWIWGDYAYQIAGQLPDHYIWVRNTVGSILKPEKGDIVVWGKEYNGWAGHTGVATGAGEAKGLSTDWFDCFQQNDPTGSVCRVKRYSFNHVIGWLRPRK